LSPVPSPLRAPGYADTRDLLEPPTFYGAGTPCGDWGGRRRRLPTEDYGSAESVRARVAAGDPRPWRADMR
jgi:hypothetical protein